MVPRVFRPYGEEVAFFIGGNIMNIEVEVRLLNVDKESIKAKLESLGAEFQWERLQKRYVYDFHPALPHKWIRLRTNGVETTLTIKNVKTEEMDGTEELEIVVDDFDKTNLILKELGYVPKALQENKRCRYYLDGVEVDIDSWPLIPDYVEIEGKNKEEVRKIVNMLGFTDENVTTKDVESIYSDYGIDLKEIAKLTLEEERK